MTLSRNQIIVGDASQALQRLPAASVDMVLTSPPYFALRDYGQPDQLGLEPDVDGWVTDLLRVMRELRRVITPTGTLWLNLGDSYAVHPRQGAGRKSLLLGPERLALALVRDGWLLRNKLIWQKANPMPTSVTDRLACTWEYVYVFSLGPSYYFDLDAVRRPHRSRPVRQPRSGRPVTAAELYRGPNSMGTAGLDKLKALGRVGHPLGANLGDVLRLASSNYRGTHRATFPVPLAEYALRAGCPAARCGRCRRPQTSQLLRAIGGTAVRAAGAPTCDCRASSEPGLVLDPFIGAGTTGLAAQALGRDWLGVELSPDYAREAEARIRAARQPNPGQAA